MHPIIRIGTRNSELALWQTHLVKRLLENEGHEVEIIEVKSEGDINLTTPLYAMNVQGIFTKTLDIALLENRIDLAVHSMKDVPTQMALGLAEMAVLERANHLDLLVHKGSLDFLNESQATVASSSIRRRAQWLNRYPDHRFESIRGNVNTRLKKLAESSWSGAIFAAAGLERIGKKPVDSVALDWMLPAPAQGAILIAGRLGDERMLEACKPLHHRITAFCVHQERIFLNRLMGGCTAPIAAWCRVDNDVVIFEGNVLSVDGREKLDYHHELPLAEANEIGLNAAEALIQKGASALIAEAQKTVKGHD